jgi:hypothetical protein
MAQANRTSADDTGQLTGWIGWVLFAAVIMVVGGVVNIIEGLVALFRDDYYQVRSSGLVVNVDYTAWGWTLLAIGAALVLVGFGVATGQTWARVTGVVLACVNAVVNLGFIAAYPVWVVLAMSLDVIVIYALIVHGREAKVLRS